MKKILSLLLFAFVTSASLAQVDTLSPEKKARERISRIRDNTVRAITPADLRNAFGAIADMSASRVPFLTMEQLRAGLADTARVVQVNEGDKSGTFILDPNDNATIDDAAMTIVANGKRYKRQYSGPVNVKWFGIKPDFDTTSKVGTHYYASFNSLFAKYKNVFIPAGNYLTAVFPVSAGLTVTGEVGTNIYLKRVGSPLSTVVMVQIGSNTVVRNINFRSLETDVTQQRAEINGKKNVQVDNCGFVGFLNPTNRNSWGLYIKESTDIVINNCRFDKNSQSDIALLDNCRNIVINKPESLSGGGIVLNFEPNFGNGVKYASVNGGKYRKLYLLENNLQGFANEEISINNADVDTLIYDGAGVTLQNTTVKYFQNENNLHIYGGDLKTNAVLGANLIAETSFTDVTNTAGSGSFWNAISTSSWTIERKKDSTGVYTRMNTAMSNTYRRVQTRDSIFLSGDKNLLFFIHSRSVIPTGAGMIGQVASVAFYTQNNTLISSHPVYCNRGAAGTTTDWKSQYGIVRVPDNAVKAMVNIGQASTNTTLTYDIKAIGLFPLYKLGVGTSINQITDALITTNTVKAKAIPNTAGHPKMLLGDVVNIISPTLNAPSKYVTTTGGATPVYTPIETTGIIQYVSNPATSVPTKAGLNSTYGQYKAGSIITYAAIIGGGREYRKLTDAATSDWVESIWSSGVKSLAL
jgi:hypothetical protein